MRVDSGYGDGMGVHQHGNCPLNRRLLGAVQRLAVVVAQNDDADVSFITAFHMGALILQRPCGPDSSRRVDRVVVPDISPASSVAAAMGRADGLQPGSGGGGRRIGKRCHAIVVQRDVPRRLHSVHVGRNGCSLGPGGSGDDPHG